MSNFQAHGRALVSALATVGLISSAEVAISEAQEPLSAPNPRGQIGPFSRAAVQSAEVPTLSEYNFSRMPLSDADQRELLGIPRNLRQINGALLRKIEIITSAMTQNLQISEVGQDADLLANGLLNPELRAAACANLRPKGSHFGTLIEAFAARFDIKPDDKGTYSVEDIIAVVDRFFPPGSQNAGLLFESGADSGRSSK